jgi:hypothetical protein
MGWLKNFFAPQPEQKNYMEGYSDGFNEGWEAGFDDAVDCIVEEVEQVDPKLAAALLMWKKEYTEDDR